MFALLTAIYYIYLLTSKRWELYSYIWISRLLLFQWNYRSSEWWHMGTGRSVAPRRLQPEHTASGKLGVSISLYPCVSFLWFEVTFILQRMGTWSFQHFLQYAFLCMSGKLHSMRNSTFTNRYYSSNFKIISPEVDKLCFRINLSEIKLKSCRPRVQYTHIKTILHECFGVLCAPFKMISTLKNISVSFLTVYIQCISIICTSFYTLYIILDLYFKYQKYAVKGS